MVQNEKRLLEEHGHEVIQYSRSNREMETFSAWQKCLLPFTSLFSLRSFREVKRLIRKEKIDIVHVHNTLNLVSPSVYYAAFACRVPVVQTIHNFRMLCPAGHVSAERAGVRGLRGAGAGLCGAAQLLSGLKGPDSGRCGHSEGSSDAGNLSEAVLYLPHGF